MARRAAGAGRGPPELRAAGGQGDRAATVKFGEGFLRKVGCAAGALELSPDAALAPADAGLQGPKFFSSHPSAGPDPLSYRNHRQKLLFLFLPLLWAAPLRTRAGGGRVAQAAR